MNRRSVLSLLFTPLVPQVRAPAPLCAGDLQRLPRDAERQHLVLRAMLRDAPLHRGESRCAR